MIRLKQRTSIEGLRGSCAQMVLTQFNDVFMTLSTRVNNAVYDVFARALNTSSQISKRNASDFRLNHLYIIIASYK